MMDWANNRGPLRMDPLSDEVKETVTVLREALVAFMNEAERPTMPLQYLATFLLVAIKPRLSVNEYAQLAQVSNSVVSRHLLDIGDRNRHKEAGSELITGRPNPMDFRKNEYFLTPKGRVLAERMAGIVARKRG